MEAEAAAEMEAEAAAEMATMLNKEKGEKWRKRRK
jgi:hypothetical protein